MKNIYKKNIETKELIKLDSIEENCWIELVNPDINEINEISNKIGADTNLLIKMLDEEELPRIEIHGESTLIVIDTPFIENNKYVTYPLGILIVNNYIVTITLKQIKLLEDFKLDKIETFETSKKTRFLIQILNKTADTYLRLLNNVNNDLTEKEKILSKTTNNKHLIDLLTLEKTLVYFLNSLKANEIVLDKLIKGNILPMFEDDKELLDDTIIEVKQAIEMSTLYKDILSSVTDTYATIVSNNLNEVMKFLAGITIVFSVPTMIASFFGMNVPLGDISRSDISLLLIISISIFVALLLALFLKKKDML